jgi:hypothetical protein
MRFVTVTERVNSQYVGCSPSNTIGSSAPAMNRQLAVQNGAKAGQSHASLWVQLIENSDVTATVAFQANTQ